LKADFQFEEIGLCDFRNVCKFIAFVTFVKELIFFYLLAF